MKKEKEKKTSRSHSINEYKYVDGLLITEMMPSQLLNQLHDSIILLSSFLSLSLSSLHVIIIYGYYLSFIYFYNNTNRIIFEFFFLELSWFAKLSWDLFIYMYF